MRNLMLTFEMLQTLGATFPDGFTVDAKTFQPITKGFAVAVADTQNSFGNVGAAKVAAYVATHKNVNAVGGWYNQENKQYYFDAVIIVNDLETAKKLGRENKQIAVFDLENLQEIIL